MAVIRGRTYWARAGILAHALLYNTSYIMFPKLISFFSSIVIGVGTKFKTTASGVCFLMSSGFSLWLVVICGPCSITQTDTYCQVRGSGVPCLASDCCSRRVPAMSWVWCCICQPHVPLLSQTPPYLPESVWILPLPNASRGGDPVSSL